MKARVVTLDPVVDAGFSGDVIGVVVIVAVLVIKAAAVASLADGIVVIIVANGAMESWNN